jgi:hypothetical protein
VYLSFGDGPRNCIGNIKFTLYYELYLFNM